MESKGRFGTTNLENKTQFFSRELFYITFCTERFSKVAEAVNSV